MAEPGASVTRNARRYRRKYITPEDVTEALLTTPVDRVRLDVLAVIGKQTSYGAEDPRLCAYIAWQGPGEDDIDTCGCNAKNRAEEFVVKTVQSQIEQIVDTPSCRPDLQSVGRILAAAIDELRRDVEHGRRST